MKGSECAFGGIAPARAAGLRGAPRATVLALVLLPFCAWGGTWTSVTVVTSTGWEYSGVTVETDPRDDAIAVVKQDGGRKRMSRSEVEAILDADGRDITNVVFAGSPAAPPPSLAEETAAPERAPPPPAASRPAPTPEPPAPDRTYRGLGVLRPRTSVEGDFDDTIILGSSAAVVDVPSVGDSWGWGALWAGHSLPGSGFGGGAEIGYFRGAMTAPGALAPPGGYLASHWNLYFDFTPGLWIPLGLATSMFQVSLAGRAGAGYQHLTIRQSAYDGSNLLNASYGGFRLRYGGGVRARLGGRRPLLVSFEWIRNKGGFGGVSIGGDSLEFQESLDGTATDLMVTAAIMFFPPAAAPPGTRGP